MNMQLVQQITKKQLRTDIPNFKPGDTLKVYVTITEGDKTRVQLFEGVCIARKGGGISETFTVRKKSGGIGVERIFPVNTPTIESIVVVKKGLVRRANLSFIKNMKKDYKVKERN
jgi:large subunit ribosomal protein L19